MMGELDLTQNGELFGRSWNLTVGSKRTEWMDVYISSLMVLGGLKIL
jgi:hypothetical protein